MLRRVTPCACDPQSHPRILVVSEINEFRASLGEISGRAARVVSSRCGRVNFRENCRSRVGISFQKLVSHAGASRWDEMKGRARCKEAGPSRNCKRIGVSANRADSTEDQCNNLYVGHEKVTSTRLFFPASAFSYTFAVATFRIYRRDYKGKRETAGRR